MHIKIAKEFKNKPYTKITAEIHKLLFIDFKKIKDGYLILPKGCGKFNAEHSNCKNCKHQHIWISGTVCGNHNG